MFTPSRTGKMELAVAKTWKIFAESTLKKRNPVISSRFWVVFFLFSAHCSSGTRPCQAVSFQHGWNPHGLPAATTTQPMARQSISQKLWVHHFWYIIYIYIYGWYFHDFLILWPYLSSILLGTRNVSWYRYWKGFSIPSAASPQRQPIFWTIEASWLLLEATTLGEPCYAMCSTRSHVGAWYVSWPWLFLRLGIHTTARRAEGLCANTQPILCRDKS